MGFNITEASEKVGIKESTLRKWEEDFKIDVPRNRRGYREYTEEIIKIFENIKGYKDSNHGENTIIRKLGLHDAFIQSEQPGNLERKEEVIEVTYNLHESLKDIETSLIARMDDKLDSIMELSEKYSRASYEVGSLKSELKSAYEKIDILKEKYEEKLHLITDGSGKDINNLKKDLEKTEFEKQQIFEENEKLKAELEKQKSKTLFQKLFGK
jgi:DNA-binding transcriptional MerR regulator